MKIGFTIFQGVGFAADLVVCVALGIDMFDCVFPTRTAVGALINI